MKTFVIRYGLYAGLLLAAFVVIGFQIMKETENHMEYGLIYGYASMLVSFVFIFVGVKKYRDFLGEKGLKFGRAFGAGLLMMAIACLLYSAVWTTYVFGIDTGWVERYVTEYSKAIQTSDKYTPEEKTEKLEEMKKWEPVMKSPLGFAAFGFTEPFLPGIFVSLIAALILKRKRELS